MRPSRDGRHPRIRGLRYLFVLFSHPSWIYANLVRASSTIFHRAIAIHGEANMALPADTPHPANLYPLKFYPPGSEVPVWMLAHMADVEEDEEAGAERVVGLV
ncbi:hypothetical protein B0H14DRAFT_2946223 [Mycena olivaceomarginata]|nr:hypothetical protein B0H14DRAFT_2946223 [Mycena olivaceomarginata]